MVLVGLYAAYGVWEIMQSLLSMRHVNLTGEVLKDPTSFLEIIALGLVPIIIGIALIVLGLRKKKSA